MSTVFQQEEAELQRTPVYYAVFETGPTTFSTHKVRVRVDGISEAITVNETFTIDETKVYTDEFSPTQDLDHSPIADMFSFADSEWGTSAAMPYMQLPTTTTPTQIYPEQGICSAGAVQLIIEDINDEVTALLNIAGDGLIGKRVQVFAGFAAMDEGDYEPVYAGSVQSIRLSSNLSAYEIQVHNTQAKVNQRLLAVVSLKLGAPIIATDLTMVIPDLTAAQYNSLDLVGYVLIDSEVIKYRRDPMIIPPVPTLWRILEHGCFDSIVSEHAVDTDVHEIIPIVSAHPVDIILDRYYGTASRTCLGLRYDEIDWLGFAQARALIGTDIRMQFFITKEDNLLDWLRRELYVVCGAYPFVTAAGQISMKVFTPFAASTATFNNESITSTNGIPDIRYELGFDSLGQPINDVTWNYDLNPATGEYHSFYRMTRPASIAKYGRFAIVINSAGLRAGLAGTYDFVVNRSEAILDQYENGAPIINIRTHLQKQAADVGAVARLTSALLPNRLTGTRGVFSAKVEIINRAPHWDSGAVDYTLLGASDQL
jgi:hypothetical protein